MIVTAIGLMSGTSMDGIDVALIETDGEGVVRFGPVLSAPYNDDDRAILRAGVAGAAALRDRRARPPELARAEDIVLSRHEQAVRAFLAINALNARDVAIVGYHGQTVLHRPQDQLTIQIGDGDGLARRLKRPVAHDFRACDVAAGGQGAPLTPIYHQALASSAGFGAPVALLNIGGVANLTFVTPNHAPVACDCGPGNALIDDLMLRVSGQAMDRDGQCAARGRPDDDLIAQWLENPFFSAKAPKSLDRNHFAGLDVSALSPEDGAATLTRFTARAALKAFTLAPQAPQKLIICGGGARNPTLMRDLAQFAPCPVHRAEDFGWTADFMEAQAFAYLAVRRLRNLPISFPTTTGAPTAMTGGVLSHP